MKAFIISDKDYQTEILQHIDEIVCSCLNANGFIIEHQAIAQQDLANCMGCFGCWIKKPGECLIKDSMAEINNKCMNSDVVVYLSPVIFVQFSANIKNAIDRSLPNMLPFFITRPDSSTMHTQRYQTYPQQFIIGYGETITDEDAQLFVDITKKHRNNIESLVYRGNPEEIINIFGLATLERVGGGL